MKSNIFISIFFPVLCFVISSIGVHAQTAAKFHSWAATPPMGWNSWDCFGPTVTEAEVKSNADYMAKYLKPYGWNYVVVDIRWYVGNDKAHGYNETNPDYVLDEYGRFLPAVNRFPSAAGGKGFKPLADYLHGKGLKFGIHIMRGIPVIAVERNLPVKGTNVTASDIYSDKDQCLWLHDMYTVVPEKLGAQEYYNSLFELYASWGLDLVKVDDLSSPIYFEKEIEMIRRAIDRTGREIVLSTSPGETPVAHADHVQQYANMWRTVDDFWDNWGHLKAHFAVFQRWNKWRAYGAWPDGDMLPLGRIGIRAERGNPRMTNFTRDEQYTLMTLWSIFKSPLMFGGNLPDNDAFTLSLLTNKNVLKVLNGSTDNQPLFMEEDKAAWIADEPGTGAKYLAVFNIGDKGRLSIPVNLSTFGFTGPCTITDLWSGKVSGKYTGEFAPEINEHGAGLYKITPVKGTQLARKLVKNPAYLFTYFTGNGNDAEAIRFAISQDGFNYKALNNNMPVIDAAAVSATGGLRDPHIIRGIDGKTFYMVATDLHVAQSGWGPNDGMVLLKSTDLIHWTSHMVNMPERFPALGAVSKVWAPQTIYDPQQQKYMIYWSMSFGDGPIKLYYAYANPDFTTLETTPQQLFFSPDSSTCLDADIIFSKGKYHLFFKATGKTPGIKQAISDRLTEGYVLTDKRLEQTNEAVEGSGMFKLNHSNTWILMYDIYKNGKYQFTESQDLENFKAIDDKVSMDFHPRHGTVVSITAKEAEVLTRKWGAPRD